VIDNYDSFAYNLVQYLAELGLEPHIARNSELDSRRSRQQQAHGGTGGTAHYAAKDVVSVARVGMSMLPGAEASIVHGCGRALRHLVGEHVPDVANNTPLVSEGILELA
jgi:hypothetical protein